MRKLFEYWQMGFTLASHYHQILAWEDARQARIARERAEASAAEQSRAMLDANPSGQLGRSQLDDEQALKSAGLL
jgi:hypothetical protein